MMRAGALSFSRWRRSLLSRNGARWLTAQVSSMPSFVSCRVPYIAPALLTSTSSFGQRASTSAANLRTEACDERSAMNVATVAPLPAAALMRADAIRVLVLLRPTIARFAPSAASASAAANPMPLVAPVIKSACRSRHRNPTLWPPADHLLDHIRLLAREPDQPLDVIKSAGDDTGGIHGPRVHRPRNNRRDRPVCRHPDRGAIAWGGVDPGQRARCTRDRARRRGVAP